MKQQIAALIACGLVAGVLMPIGELAAKDKGNAEPLKVVDAAGRTVGRLYGNAKGDHAVVNLGNGLGSLKLVEDGPYLMPAESTNSILWSGPHCAGQPVIVTGGQLGGSLGLPNVPTIGSSKGADHRFTVYWPTTSTVQRIMIYSQGVPGPTCNDQFPAFPAYGVPAQAASLDSYFVLPFHIE